MRVTRNKLCCILSRLARSRANLVFKNGCFWAIIRTMVLKIQDDHRCAEQALQRGLLFFIAIGVSNDCKWVFNEVSRTPWCHAAVHF